jgi:ribosomal protein S16
VKEAKSKERAGIEIATFPRSAWQNLGHRQRGRLSLTYCSLHCPGPPSTVHPANQQSSPLHHQRRTTSMPLRIRMSVHGRTNYRVFHINVVEGSRKRDAKPYELLGVYDPHVTEGSNTKTIQWSVDRIRYWLSVGALPSRSVVKLLELVSSRSWHCGGWEAEGLMGWCVL